MPAHYTRAEATAVIDDLYTAVRSAAAHGFSPIDRELIAAHFAWLRGLPAIDCQLTLATDPKTKMTQVLFKISPQAFGERRNA